MAWGSFVARSAAATTRRLGGRCAHALRGAVPRGLAAAAAGVQDTTGCLQLYVFEAPPREMLRLAPAAEAVLMESLDGANSSSSSSSDSSISSSPIDSARITSPQTGLSAQELVRAVHRAAHHPWRDARFWRRAADQLTALDVADVQGRDLAQVCHAFQRIRFTSPVLVRYCEQFVETRRQALNTFELALVAAYCVSTCTIAHSEKASFARVLADEACVDWRRREVVPWQAWKRLVCAVARAGVAHQALIAIASPHLASNVPHMSGRDATAVCEAYAALRLKHTGLLEEMSRFLPSMGLSDRQVWSLQSSFERLEYEAPLLNRISEMRRDVTYVGGHTL